MITIETRDDYITMTRLLRKSRTNHIRLKIMGNDYLWVKNVFTKEYRSSIHDIHLSACRYIHSCSLIARIKPSIKKEQVHDARKFVESNRLLVKLKKERGDA